MGKVFDVLVLGAGSAGLTVSARLKNSGQFKSIALIDPSDNHYYQPLWTLVGNGLIDKEKTVKPMKSVVPKGVEWIQESVTEINADNNEVSTNKRKINYKYLRYCYRYYSRLELCQRS
jgi:sulfide:quinone oxidoreductase